LFSKSLLLVIVLLVGVWITGITVTKPANTEKVQVIVVFKEKPDSALIKEHGGAVKYSYKIIPGIAASLPRKAVAALERNPAVAYIEEDAIVASLRGQKAKRRLSL